MTHTIVSLGVGQWYPRGIERLARSCQKHNAPYYLQTEYPKGVPTHKQLPYAFKPYMIRQVALTNSVVLWLDSSCYLQHDPKPLFEHIEKHGYLLFDSGHHNHNWCNDKQLEAFGFTRDEAETQKHVIGGIVGLNLDSEIGKEIFAEWYLNIDLFKGHWNNDNLTESQDARCLGSRHDQSVLSLIAAKLNLNITPCAGWLSFDINDKLAVILAQGM